VPQRRRPAIHFLLYLALLCPGTALLNACSGGPGDDDSADDDDLGDDDETPPPEPLADVIGVFNLTNVVRSAGSSYIDFSGAFGTFASVETDTLSPTAYLGTFNYSADAPYWRPDLGGFPIPAEGESLVVNLFEYYPWDPTAQEWWDGGPRIGLGNFLCSRLDLEVVSAYQVDDPLSPGAAAWQPGGTLDWQNPGGTDVVAASFEHGVSLPFAAGLLQPSPATLNTSPAAHDLAVTWSTAADGAAVSIALLRGDDLAYIASVPDSGSHSIPASVLHDEFGPGEALLVLARTLTSTLEHPQGDVLVRAREERRAPIELLADIVLAPAYGEPAQTVTASLHWYTGSFSASSTVEIGQANGAGGIDPDGITITALVPDPADSSRADLQISIAFTAATGPRDVKITTGASTMVLAAGFTVLDLMPSDDCGSALAMVALEPGSYASSTAGLSNTLSSGFSCLPWSLNGADSTYRIHLEAGEVLSAALLQPEPADGALALLATCGDPTSAVACADSTLIGETEVLSYVAPSAGDYFLVVDSYVSSVGGASASPFSLDVAIHVQPLRPGWILPGQSRSFVLSGESPWGGAVGAAAVDLGSGITTDSVTAGASPEQLAVQATASLAALPGPRSISVDEGGGAAPVQFSDALYVTGWPSYDSCAEAAAAPPLVPGTNTGYGVQTSSHIGTVPCFSWASTGPELFMPLDLAVGDSVDITVDSAEDIQLYVLRDCNLPESCIAETAVDETFGDDAETITGWTPNSSGRYYLVIDNYTNPSDPLAAWQYDLELSVQ
jgi:hypothetical protein